MKAVGILFCTILVGLIGCAHKAPTILFILPDGYSGLLLISADPHAGSNCPSMKGQYVVNVPRDGNVRLKNISLFSDWHKEAVQYENGEKIATEAPAAASAPCLRALTFIQNKGFYYFVGTWQECDLMASENNLEKLPLATKLDVSKLRR